jgi:hypothetical protein
MTWFEDLSPYELTIGPLLRTVGWLDRTHCYPRGLVTNALFGKLCRLLSNPWSPWVTAGVHACELCQFQAVDGSSEWSGMAGLKSAIACGELFIPGNNRVYLAPVMIAHYIGVHWYAPPEEFCEAVMDSPEMRSRAYYAALLANGARPLVRHLSGNDQ